MKGISAPPGASLPLTEAHCIVATHYPLHSPPYSLLNGSPLHSDHALPSPFFSLLSTSGCRTAESPRGARPRAPTTHSSLNSSPYSLLNGSPLHIGHALPSPFFSLLSTSGCRTAESPRGARPRTPATHYPLHSSPYSLLNGSPLHSGHALPSQFFSLLPTQRHVRLKNQHSKKSIMFSEKRIYVAMQTGLYV